MIPDRWKAPLVAVVVLGAACAEPAPDGSACPDGSAPAAGVWAEEGQRPELVELWRAGGLREGQGLAFPVTVVPGLDHRAAVPDFRLGEVLVVGPAGGWEGSWTRQGEGPGEVLRPVAAAWSPEGELVVFDVEGARVVWLDSARAPSRTASLDPDFTGPVVASGSLDWAAVTPDGRAFLDPGVSPISGEARAVALLTRARPGVRGSDTVALDTIRTLSADGRFARTPVPGSPDLTAAVGPDGALHLGAADGRYRVERLSAGGGGPVLAACRPVESAPLRPAERGEGEAPKGRAALAEAIREAPEPGRLTPFGRFFVGRAGRIWVQRDRSVPGEGTGLWGVPGATYDVFGRDGRYLGSLAAPGSARLQSASGDTVWALEFGELDQASVVAYELQLEEDGP